MLTRFVTLFFVVVCVIYYVTTTPLEDISFLKLLLIPVVLIIGYIIDKKLGKEK
ncbi:hypothetical protein SPE26_29310 [Bacillus thuringiensis]|uniref:Group-specific protein n=1 Tax=Bacillus thuringiensis TaxID=1428 RepID=A0AAW9GS92_BACTU|nr:MULTISPECIES: hypothetical protein [Bacillus cereus group]MDY0854964.1 hypothetical protein [Bacillus thuringiensis]MDY4394752.1 hypothetical protein [Bacillus thuringiensis]QDD87394.1 hypothetical protein FORC087_611 [Bacillus cereus]GIX59948.1 hypothetical protein BPADB04_49780 [Bacillus paranthracis]